MTTADLIARLLRPEAPDKKFTQAEVDAINAIALSWDKRSTSPAAVPWVTAGMGRLGDREIVGPKHNKWIANGWAILDAKVGLARRYNDDETPWCGFFGAWCLDQAGLPYPKNYPSALSFSTYGNKCAPQYGAYGVKARQGGNHVFIIVGITPDRLYYKALGGNQGNAVSIVDIPVSETKFIRWPSQYPESGYLPVMPRGTIAKSEA